MGVLESLLAEASEPGGWIRYVVRPLDDPGGFGTIMLCARRPSLMIVLAFDVFVVTIPSKSCGKATSTLPAPREE